MFDNKQKFENPAVKTGIEPTFFGKVMTFFALAMGASALGTFLAFQYFLPYLLSNVAIFYGLFALELIIILTSRLWRERKPLNRLLFALFALLTGITLAPLLALTLSVAGPAIIFKALAVTALMFVASAIFGWTTKINLSGLRGFLLMALIGLIIVGIVGIFVPWSNNFELIVSGVGVVIFSGFTMYDFQKIRNYPEDAYIDAALMLYLDIFNLFVYVLRLLLALNRR